MTGDKRVLDTAGSIGPDFVCIDTQHGVHLSHLDVSTFTTLAHYGVPGLVRVSSNSDVTIGRALDLGADGVVIPLVESADDANRAVAACRYAPDGTRSYGVQTRRVDPFDTSRPRPSVWIQIETASAIDDVEAIAAVEGVDTLYIGPADLGLALCGTPAPDVVDVFEGIHQHADTMRAAFDRVVEACAQSGVKAGLHCGTGEAAARAVKEGFQVTAVAADLAVIGRALASELGAARSA